jgi:hypothetical protein
LRGSGKTYLSQEIEHTLRTQNGYDVHFFSSDTKSNLETKSSSSSLYKNYYLDIKQILEKDVLNLNNSGKSILIILDNVQSWEEIREIVSSFDSVEKLKILITTRKYELMPETSRSKKFEIGFFTIEEAKAYLSSHKFETSEIEKVINLIKINDEIWPSKLISYVEHTRLTNKGTKHDHVSSIDEIIQKASCYDFDTLPKPELTFLTFFSYFDVQLISLDILKEFDFKFDSENNLNLLIDSLFKEGLIIKHTSGVEIVKIVLYDFVQYKMTNFKDFPSKGEILNEIMKILVKVCKELSGNEISAEQELQSKRNLIYSIKILTSIESNGEIRKAMDTEYLACLYKKAACLYYYVSRQYDKALEYFQKNYDILKEMNHDKKRSDVAESLDCMGYCNRRLKMNAYQLENFSKSLEMKLLIFDANSPEIAESIYNKAYSHGKLNEMDLYETLLNQSVSLYSEECKKNISDAPNINLKCKLRFADFYGAKCDYELQLGALHESLDILEQKENLKKEKNYREKALIFYILAQCYGNLNEDKEQLENFKKSHEYFSYVYKEEANLDYADAIFALAYAYGKTQDYINQREFASKSHKMYSKLFPGIKNSCIAKSAFLLAYSEEIKGEKK